MVAHAGNLNTGKSRLGDQGFRSILGYIVNLRSVGLDWATTGWVGRREVAKVIGPTILSPGNFCLQEKPVLLHHSRWFALLLDHFPSQVLLFLNMQRMEFLRFPSAAAVPPDDHSRSSCRFPPVSSASWCLISPQLLMFLCSAMSPLGPLALSVAQTHPAKLWTMFLLFPDLSLVSTILYNALHVPQTYPASVFSFLKSTQFFVFWPLTCKLL